MTHVLIVSHDVVDRRMAGPGIRYHELARVLAGHFQVTLAVPNEPSLDGQPYEVWTYQRTDWTSLAPKAAKADVAVACGDTLADFPALVQLSLPIVIDGYDPHTLETLAMWAREPIEFQADRHQERSAILRRQCQAGDFFICASERQRDRWLGLLEQEGRVNPLTYGSDPSLRQLVDVVPYGLPAEPARTLRPVLRGVWPGLEPGDSIILWGGGLWEWLDPLTALRAVRRLVDREGAGTPVRLVFPGTRHPNPGVPEMPMRAQTMALADELELTGRYVFFGDWIPYEDWPSVLLECDVALSLHPNTAEARLAYRSRAMDYIWAGLPMVVTEGDAVSDLVRRYDLGQVVSFDDDQAVATAISTLLADPHGHSARANGFEVARENLTWEQAAAPLLAFCKDPRRAADREDPGRAPHIASAPERELQKLLQQSQDENKQLRGLVAAYERGRFMRFMRRIQQGREKVGIA